MEATKEYLSVAETAKLVRNVLKQRFPAVKFSIRSKSYSGGASINISYSMGPKTSDVEKTAHLYEGATFDGMQDLKEYHDTVLAGPNGMRRVHMGADFVFVNRNIPDEIRQQIFHDLAAVMQVAYTGDEYTKTGWGCLRDMYWPLIQKADLSNGYHGVRRTKETAGSVDQMLEIY